MTAVRFEYEELSRRVLAALRKQFPEDTIDLSEGYLGRVHVLVVSPQLNGKSEGEKQNLLWDVLRAELDPDDQQGVSFVIGRGTEELW